MTTLVTGAAGFVGLNIVRRLAEQGEPVVALARQKPDAATLRFLDGVLGLVQFAPGDVRDRAGLAYLAQHHQVRRLVHGAAVTSAE
ncbi:MAG: NAD-dependent epimerase/dehydratase family protein, partial [Chloroflexaceae bacterium]|nr:NAD-dependent epimerase/dehydratase family protein [Chloroflexaceae bacterium]